MRLRLFNAAGDLVTDASAVVQGDGSIVGHANQPIHHALLGDGAAADLLDFTDDPKPAGILVIDRYDRRHL